MPAPIEVIEAYATAKTDSRKASIMKQLDIDNTIQFWATATDSAKNIAKSFFRSSEVQTA